MMTSRLHALSLSKAAAACLVIACSVAARAAPAPLPPTREHPELYEQVAIVPMPKQMQLLETRVPLAGARLATGPEARRCEQSRIGADTINRAADRRGGPALPVTAGGADAPANGGWTIVIGTRADNPVIEQAAAAGLTDIGPGNPGERGYEIRVDAPGRRVLLAGADPIGALYACVTFAELIEGGGPDTAWRAAEVRDWPDTQRVWHPQDLFGPQDPLVWPLLLDLARTYAWAPGEIPPIPAAKREAYLSAIRAEYDRLLRWKVGAVFYPQIYGRMDEPYRPLELYDLLREGIEYGKARGFAAVRYCEYPVIGSTNRHPELAATCNRWRGYNYGWCRDDLREQTAAELAKAIARIGYTDVGFHDVDSGSYIDSPAGWESRCAECRARWSNDYAAATAHKYMAYVDALRAAAPDVRLHLVLVPYTVDILDEREGETALARRFGESADVAALAARERAHWSDIWRRWDRAFPDNVSFVFREASPEAVRAFAKLAPERGVCWAPAFLSRAWTAQFSDRPAMIGSYALGRPRDTVWMFGYADFLAPATTLATAEYAWTLETPGHRPWDGGSWAGGQPLLEHWKRGEPGGPLFDLILPHVLDAMFGRELAGPIAEALRQNVSPYQLFGYYRARMDRFNPLTTTEKMAWQAERAAAAAAAMDRAWALFRARPDGGAGLGAHETAWLVFYRELFHGAARMADIRQDTKRARELARARDEAGAQAALARARAKLAAAPATMDRLYQERAGLTNAILQFGDRLAGKANLWYSYLAKNADFRYAAEELEDTTRQLPGLLALGGVPAALLDQLARPRTVRATPFEGAVTVDGALDEPVWAGAFPQESFFVADTKDLAQAYTRAQLLFDRDTLFVGATAYAPTPDTPIGDQDCLEVFLSHPGIGRDYLHLFVYADGRLRQQYNARRENTTGLDSSTYHAWTHDSDWAFDGITAAVHRAADRWTAELRVPLAALKAESVTPRLRINLCRGALLAARAEASSIQTPPATRGFHDPASFLPVHPAGAEGYAGPECVLTPQAVTRETQTMSDCIGTVVGFTLDLDADTLLHGVRITGETYDERGTLHERRDLAAIPQVFFHWSSEAPVSLRFTKVVEQGGVRLTVESEEGRAERWIRFGGWEGTPQAGALFAPHEKGGRALAGACFFRADRPPAGRLDRIALP